MSRADRTKMGGLQSAFRTTQWRRIRAYAELSGEQQKAILDELAAG